MATQQTPTTTTTPITTTSTTTTPTTTTLPPPDPRQYDPELLFRGFLNEREVTGRTAVFLAVEVNRPKCLETLLAFRADPNIPNHKEITPLQLACERGFQTCIRVLVRNHASCAISHGKNLVELIWESVPNLDERAELLAYLIANGAQCEVEKLNGLISSLPHQNQVPFQTAIAEASLLLQKSLQQQALHLKTPMTKSTKDLANSFVIDPLLGKKVPQIVNDGEKVNDESNNEQGMGQ